MVRAGPSACAIAVYAEPVAPDGNMPPVAHSARDRGFEGVACVDDAARAVVPYSALWRRRRLASARAAEASLLRFLAHMQDEDGRFGNFVLDWPTRHVPTIEPLSATRRGGCILLV